MKNVLTIDIETIPSQRPGMAEEMKAKVKPPGNISKPETIAKWMEENAATAADEMFRKTALDGTYGEIICIGFAVDNGPIHMVYRSADERNFLQEVFEQIHINCPFPEMIVGHNAIAFDMRYLFQRAVINKVIPLFPLHHEARHGNGIFDTMVAWGGYSPDKRISLKNLCAALDIPVKSDGLDGSKVYDYWLEGRHEEIADYCKEDVAATRECYKRLTFQEV